MIRQINVCVLSYLVGNRLEDYSRATFVGHCYRNHAGGLVVLAGQPIVRHS